MNFEPQKPRVIAIINQKGGVSKTTTTANLGVIFAQRSRRTLLLDLDPQGSLSALQDLKNPRSLSHIPRLEVRSLPQVPEFYDAIEDENSHKAQDIAVDSKALDLAATILSQIENSDGEPFDFVLLDCPPTFGARHQAALKIADLAIAPMPPKFLDAHGLAQLRETVDKIQNTYNSRLQLKIVIALRDSRQSAHRQFEAAFRQALGHQQLFNTAIPYAAVFDRATLLGTTAVQLEPRSAGALAYSDLAQEIFVFFGEKHVVSQRTASRGPSPSQGEIHGASTKLKK